jgi:hypothetical protein
VESKGAGAWGYGVIITNAISFLLIVENTLSIYLGRFGIKLPGLTVWALCKKQKLL